MVAFARTNRSTKDRFWHGCPSWRGSPFSRPVIVPHLCCAISVPLPPSRMASGTKRRAGAVSCTAVAPLPEADAAAGPLLIFYTAFGMTRALEKITADGHGAAITPEPLAGTSPFLTEHLNRYSIIP
jgi:hypothetical protein